MKTYLMLLICALFFEVSAAFAEMKGVQKSYTVSEPHMVGDGFSVYNYFTGNGKRAQDFSPFLLLDYNAPYVFPSSPGHLKGVGAHPHRGFETVTIVYEGAVSHRDSTGSGGVINAGDVQWMTAGSGILHEEFHEKNFSDQGGILHAVQLWVNLPAKDKMTKPNYQTLLNMEIPTVEKSGSMVRIIAGEYEGKKGLAKTFTPINIFDVRMKKNSAVSFSLPSANNTMLLVTKGCVSINATKANFKDLVIFNHKGDSIEALADQESMFLLLSGEPIQEPIVSDGPFVMNTKQEISQAYNDFHSGKFGQLD